MLILTRKPGEKLYIGDKIVITIVEIKGHQIRVGIDAPAEFRIYREEIYLQIMEENQQAAAASTGAGLEGLADFSGLRGTSSGRASPLASGTAARLGGNPLKSSSSVLPKPDSAKPEPDRSSKGPEVVVRRRKSKSEHE